MTMPGIHMHANDCSVPLSGAGGACAAVTTAGAAGGRWWKRPQDRHVLALTWQPGFCLTKPKSSGMHAAAGGVGCRASPCTGCGRSRELLWHRCRPEEARPLQQMDGSAATGAFRRNGDHGLPPPCPASRPGSTATNGMMNGTCHAATAEDYYVRSLEMLDAVNASAVGAFFEAQAGRSVTMAERRRRL